MVGSIFGTHTTRGRLSTGQVIARDVTRTVTNKVVGGIVFAGTNAGASATITQNSFTLGVNQGAILAEGNNTLTISGGTIDFGANATVPVSFALWRAAARFWW